MISNLNKLDSAICNPSLYSGLELSHLDPSPDVAAIVVIAFAEIVSQSGFLPENDKQIERKEYDGSVNPQINRLGKN